MSILAVSRDDYHADPLDQPSLSASIAHILITQSPAHARAAHPRLNPALERDSAAHFDIGTAAHALLLEGRNAVEVIDAPDWKTKAAKEQRDEARAAGKTPMLAHQWTSVREMVDAALLQIERLDVRPLPFTDGLPEQAVAWQEDGVQCRSLIDWLSVDKRVIDDYKTTGRSANPEQWTRSLFSFGGDVQAAFYKRAVRALGAEADFRFVVQETSPPYALSVVGLGPDVLLMADRKVEYALAVWKRCLEDDHWPGYPSQVCYAELPAWEEYRWLDREAREAA